MASVVTVRPRPPCFVILDIIKSRRWRPFCQISQTIDSINSMARVKRTIRTDCRPKFKTVPKATAKSAPIDGGVCFCSASKKNKGRGTCEECQVYRRRQNHKTQMTDEISAGHEPIGDEECLPEVDRKDDTCVELPTHREAEIVDLTGIDETPICLSRQKRH